MILSLWKRLLYFLGFAGLLYFLFPTNTEMVLLYLESDDPFKGQLFMEEALAKNPDDFDLLVFSGELHWANDRVEAAIGDLRRAVTIRPNNPRALILLASYLEWSQDMDGAYAVWQRVIARDPGRQDVAMKLAGMAKYLDRPDAAGYYAALWLTREKKLPKRFDADKLVKLWTGQLAQLARERVEEGLDRPGNAQGFLRDDMLYDMATWVFKTTDQGGGYTAPEPDVLYKEYLRGGCEDRAVELAIGLDGGGKDLTERFKLLTLLDVGGMGDRVGPVMLAMAKQAPDQEDALLAFLDLGEQQDDNDTKTLVLERLTRLNPLQERYRTELIGLYVDSGSYDRIAELMDHLAWFTGEGVRYVKQVMAAAFVSEDERFMRKVASEADKVHDPGRDLLAARARLAVALHDMNKITELYQALYALAPGEAPDLLKDLIRDGKDIDPEAMGEALTVALALSPENLSLLRLSARNALTRGRPETAFALFGRVLALSHDEADLMSMLEAARASASPGQLEGEALVLGLKQTQMTPQVLDLAADVYLELDKPVEAYEAACKAARLGPDQSRVARMLELAQSTGRGGDVRDSLALARELRPGDPALVRKMAEAALGDSDMVQAERTLKEALDLDPKDVWAIRRLADVYSWTNRYALQAGMLSRLAALGQATTAEMARLATAKEASGDGIGALEMVLALLREAPEDRELTTQAINYALWHGRPQVAAELSEKLARKPGGEKFEVQTGMAWLAANEPGRARPWLERAREQGLGGVEALRLLAQACQALELNRELVGIIQDIERKDVLTAEETTAMAQAYAALRDWPQAYARLAPLAAGKRLELEGELLFCQTLDKTGRANEATPILQALSSRHAGDAPVLSRVGEIAYSGGRFELARDIYRQAVAAQPKNPVAIRGLATVLADLGKNSTAARLMQEHNAIDPDDSDSHLQTGELNLALGNEARAYAEYKKALRLLRRKPQTPGEAVAQ